jgi:UDP-2,4-diacetamido-2,4,6-trideoxy-beta-L-altropyranose hydrolase
MFIRADATPFIGTGHVMRCIALAQAASDAGWDVQLAGRVRVPWVAERLAREGVSFMALDGEVPEEECPSRLLRQIGQASANWVVLDGYHFGSDCHHAVRNAGYNLLIIDDYAHLPEYSCDILLNQNIGAGQLLYTGEIGKKLFGPEYALLRREFTLNREKALARTFPEKPRNVLLSLGGGDMSQLLEKLAPTFFLPELTGCTLRVVAGQMSPLKIQEILRGCPASLEIMEDVTDMPALMLWADICVTAGGSTCWELCCLGVPFLAVDAAENQHEVVNYLHTRGIAPIMTEFSLRSALSSYREFYATSTHKALSLCSGNGALAVVYDMADNVFSLRKVTEHDSNVLLHLANDADVRATSFSPEPISRIVHAIWFANRIKKSDEPFYLAWHGEELVGYIRFDKKNNMNTLVTTVALSPCYRGRGLGKKLIAQGVQRAYAQEEQEIIAWVRSDHSASICAFLAAGFVDVGCEVRHGVEARLLRFLPLAEQGCL